ncbi:hypothetical protein D3C78_1365830 [compost metagenome]
MKCSTPKTITIISTKFHRVTRAPPNLSATQPPRGRTRAPTSGPRKAKARALTSGNEVLISIGKAAEKPMNEPKVARYSQHISQLCLRLKITACSLNEALALDKSFMPNQASRVTAMMNGTHRKPAFCSHNWLPSASTWGCPPSTPNTPKVITSGTANCITETPRLPRPAFRPSAVPCCDLG